MRTKKEWVIKERIESLNKNIEHHIPLWLANYPDLFSIFDSRPFSIRAISDDFLQELKRASRDKPNEKLEVELFIPKNNRDLFKEKVIRKRLSDHFKKHSERLRKENKNILIQGLLFVFFGIIALLIATYFLTHLEETFLINFLIVVLEPGGWFLFWEGLNLIIFDSKRLSADRVFYDKMNKSHVYFSSN